MSIFRAVVGIVLVVALSGCAAAPGSDSGASARRDSGRPGDRGLRSVPTGATYDGSQPFVISGSPQRDTEAYRSASDALEEADWQVLEQYGPRNMWSNLFDKQDRLQDRRQERSAPVEPPPLALVPAVKPRTVPQVVRLDGQVQIYYRLWHYGGAGVKNARKHGYDLPAIEVNDGVLDPLVKIVQNYLGEKGTVEPLPSENMLVITCDPPMQTGVMQLLQNIDTSRRQVQITVRIFEVSDDFDFQFGVRTVLKHLSATDSQAFLGNFDAASFAGKAIDPFNA
ncbi:MAG: hypothetical protein OER86_08185, partial [Phycisphaerae bacterium]|nr:hypothetical protein [Phycisphaerae bacterium]